MSVDKPHADQHGDEDSGIRGEDARRRLRNGLIWLCVLLAIVVGLLLAIPRLHEVGRAMLQMSPPLLLVAVLFEVLSNLGYVICFLLVFRQLPFRLGARVALAEAAFGTAVPLGGAGSAVLGAWLLVERGAPRGKIAERSAVLFLLTSGINALTLGMAGFVAWTGVLPGRRAPLLTLLPGAVGLGVCLFFLALPPLTGALGRAAVRGDRGMATVAQSRGGRWATVISETIRDTARAMFTPNWRLLGAWGYLWFDIGVLWLCFQAIGASPPLTTIVLVYQIGYLSSMIPIPGGIGVLDGSFVGLFTLYGVRVNSAIAATLVYHAIALWVPALWGGFAFLRLRADKSATALQRPGDDR